MRGDPTALGWGTTALYLVTAGFAAVCARRHQGDGRLRLFWGLSAVAALGLGINKQLDLQIDLIRVAKGTVTQLGLYPDHRLELMLGVGVVAGLGLALTVGLLAWLTRGRLRATRLALAGWVLIASFIALRAATFHHLDELGLRFLRSGGIAALEIGGLVLLLVASRARPEGIRRAGAKRES